MTFKDQTITAFQEYTEQDLPDWKFFKVGKFKIKPFKNTLITLGLHWRFNGVGAETGKVSMNPYIYIKHNQVSKAAASIFGNKSSHEDAYCFHMGFEHIVIYATQRLIEKWPDRENLLTLDKNDHVIKDLIEPYLSALNSSYDLRSEQHLLTNLKEVKPRHKVEPITPDLYSSDSALYCITRIMTGHTTAAQDYLEKYRHDLSNSEQRTLQAVADHSQNLPILFPK